MEKQNDRLMIIKTESHSTQNTLDISSTLVEVGYTSYNSFSVILRFAMCNK